MTTFQRLLKHPHAAVFSKDPDADLALRVRHPSGAAWSVADNTLTVKAGALERSYNLAEFTVGELAGALIADGFDVPELGSGWPSRSALALAEGSGTQLQSNGDRLHAFRSLLWVMLSSYAGEVRGAQRQVAEALRQMVLTQAEGDWLDLWGNLYGVPRRDGELDAGYAPRIAREVLRLRVNGHGIERAILDETGWDVRIEEPWKDLFILDQSALSGPHRLYDGENYGYHLIRPVAMVPVDRDVVMSIVNRNRAAGVVVLDVKSLYRAVTDGSGSFVAAYNIVRRRIVADIYEDHPLLDFMAIEDAPILNHDLRHIRINVRRAEVILDPADYESTSKHSRTYRIHHGDSAYESRYWMDSTWIKAGGDWEISTTFDTDHTSLS